MEITTSTDFVNVPIPELKSTSGWKEIPIRECGEPLVPLNTLNPDLIAVDPQYFKQGLGGSIEIQYARSGVAERLSRAARALPHGLRLLIWDAWRPLDVQQALFDAYHAMLAKEHPTLAENELLDLTQTYVSLPSTNPLRPSPHNTGGSIDLTVIDQNGRPLDMGTQFDHFGPEAATTYCEGINPVDHKAFQVRENRRILYHTMNQAGFSSYPEEWWHFDFGNQFDAIRTEKPHAIYGAVSPEKYRGVIAK